MVITWRNIGSQGPKGVKGGFLAPFHLQVDVLFDLVHRDMARAFDHDLDVLGPRPLGQFAEGAQFGQLGLVVRIRNRTGPKPIAEREGDIVSGKDLAELVKVRVEEVLLVMGQAPRSHHGPSAAHDSSDPFDGQVNVAQ